MKVIPANAGVILVAVVANMQKNRYPRECGGDPSCKEIVIYL